MFDPSSKKIIGGYEVYVLRDEYSGEVHVNVLENPNGVQTHRYGIVEQFNFSEQSLPVRRDYSDEQIARYAFDKLVADGRIDRSDGRRIKALRSKYKRT